MTGKQRVRIEFNNDFHHTTSVSFAEPVYGGLRLTKSQAARASRRLCGMRGCECGKYRGPITSNDGARFIWDIDRTYRLDDGYEYLMPRYTHQDLQ